MLLIRTGERYLNCELLRVCSADAYAQQNAFSVDWDSLLKQAEVVLILFCLICLCKVKYSVCLPSHLSERVFLCYYLPF